jgi:hypothetical protein
MSTYQFLNASQVTSVEWEKLKAMLEAFYNTQNDPDQIQIRPSSTGKNWISTRIPECAVIIKSGDELVGSTLVLPCTQAWMQDFITGRINEAQLAEKIRESDLTYETMETIYSCSAFIVPEHRGKGLAAQALIHSIRNITTRKIPIFYWEYSTIGKIITEKYAAHLGVELYVRKIG